jgi:lysine decarboxylase
MAIKGWNIPIYSAVKAYTDTNPIPFHMPGHKLGAGIPKELLEDIEKLDLTEIPGTDNLHRPSGAIKEAQRLAAKAFGARETFFLVNGSTVGLHAAIAATTKRGQSLIVGRDCHRSVVDGLLLAGVKPHFVLPQYYKEYEISAGLCVEAVEKALLACPDAVGVLITRPNYYGVCSDVSAIARLVHSYGKLLIVDEAHGAHLAFSPRLPICALKAGADICIQSAHKTLPALTQGAYLHVGSERVDIDRVKYFLDIYQTTSPSYIIMAFLDIAREVMEKNGRRLIDGLLDTIEKSSVEAAQRGIKILGKGLPKGFEQDFTRITINTESLGLSGYDAEKYLRDKCNIQVEMSDLYNIVCISTTADNISSVENLFSGIQSMAGSIRCNKPPVNMSETYFGLKLPKKAAEPYEVLNSKGTKITLRRAFGRISREMIVPYPPGVAIVCPGEVFSTEVVELLQNIVDKGGIVHGIDENGNVNVV